VELLTKPFPAVSIARQTRRIVDDKPANIQN
jgi:hypothetical protein